MNRFKAFLIAIDQLFNTLFGGWPDETLSSRIYRNTRAPNPRKRWRIALRLVNGLFFWQPHHCKTAYESELKRRHVPLELRN